MRAGGSCYAGLRKDKGFEGLRHSKFAGVTPAKLRDENLILCL